MIFVATVTMTKHTPPTVHVRASTSVVLNAKSEQEAIGHLLASADVVQWVNDGWWIGQPSALLLTPESLLQDADLCKGMQVKTKQEAPFMAQITTNVIDAEKADDTDE